VNPVIQQESVNLIGKAAMQIVLAEKPLRDEIVALLSGQGYRIATGQVGSMNLERVVAAIETASKREGVTRADYPEEHALYHAILDSLQGVGRGQMALGTILRTVGLRFAIVRGPRAPGESGTGDWVAVAIYGQIGGPQKGNEHECVGLGINHL
jgi:hut operon positive regulatory protein